jgi:NAD(P)-dependent dehydrogenase (short-subunit alcohol dehydrogenase family)
MGNLTTHRTDCVHHPNGTHGAPDEIAKAALFLASDDSRFVTGIELFVDGGQRANLIESHCAASIFERAS